jgi:hypothetical protein
MPPSVANAFPGPGSTVAGYRLVRLLVERPGSAVYEAQAPAGGPVALKLWIPAAGLRERARGWLAFEHDFLVAPLAPPHPLHLPVCHAAGESGGALFVATERLAAPGLCNRATLADLGPRRALESLAAVALAVHAAHGVGLVHLDLRPDRLLFAQRTPQVPPDRVKVTGFGLSVRRWRRLAGEVVGAASPADAPFLAPEQTRPGPVDRRADVFALGALLRHVLALAAPEGAEAPMLAADPSRALDEAVRAALAPDPGQRPATLVPLIEALHALTVSLPELRSCGRCGRPVADGWRFCVACGSALTAAGARAPARGDGKGWELGRDREAPGVRSDGEGWELGSDWEVRDSRSDREALDDRGGGVVHERQEAAPRDQGPAPVGLPFPLDGSARFTVYQPGAIAPGRWEELLAFVHPGGRDPAAEVARQAEQFLAEETGGEQPRPQFRAEVVPRAGEILLVPVLPGVDVLPPSRRFRWLQPVHLETFRLFAPGQLEGQTVRGRLQVFRGRIVVAEVPLCVRVDSGARGHAPGAGAHQRVAARPYSRLFASYAPEDEPIAAEVTSHARDLGLTEVAETAALRARERWSDRIAERIEAADVFQLFWSARAMRSPQVQQEWEHALALGRPDLVRPIYWEDPMPRAPGLPPPALSRLHFFRLRLASDGQTSPRSRPPGAATGEGRWLDRAGAERMIADARAWDTHPAGPPGLALLPRGGPPAGDRYVGAGKGPTEALRRVAQVPRGVEARVMPPVAQVPRGVEARVMPPVAQVPRAGELRTAASPAAASPAPTVPLARIGADPGTVADGGAARPRRSRSRWVVGLVAVALALGIGAFTRQGPELRGGVARTAPPRPQRSLEEPRSGMPRPTSPTPPPPRTASPRGPSFVRIGVGDLAVQSHLPVAIEIDGLHHGTTPLTQPIELPAGTHELVAKRPGHAPERRHFAITAGQRTTIHLEPPTPTPRRKRPRPKR